MQRRYDENKPELKTKRMLEPLVWVYASNRLRPSHFPYILASFISIFPHHLFQFEGEINRYINNPTMGLVKAHQIYKSVHNLNVIRDLTQNYWIWRKNEL